ncbi:hypothetical protein GCM10027168_01250 [Streptomyces capparidis]
MPGETESNAPFERSLNDQSRTGHSPSGQPSQSQSPQSQPSHGRTRSERSPRVRGDLVGAQVAVADKVVRIRADGHSAVVFAGASGTPLERRPLPPAIDTGHGVTGHGVTARGRERELARLAEAVAAGETVQVHGGRGTGKTTLLLHAADRGVLCAGALPGCEGALLLSARGLTVAELLQEVVLATHTSPGPRLPAPGELRALLAALRVLLVVDDLECTGEELARLTGALPRSVLVVASARATLTGRGCPIGLGGLPFPSAAALFRDALRRELTEDETARAHRVWRATGGHAGRLGMTAAYLRRAGEHGVPPRVPPADGLALLVPRLVQWLGEPAAGLLRWLAAAGDAEWGAALAAGLREDGAEGVAELVRSHLLERRGERLRLAGGVAAAVDGARPETVRAVAERVAAWVASAGAREAAAEAEVITALAARASSAGLHRAVLGLARAAAPRLMLGLRWREWGRVLELGLGSARASGSARDEAYFTHEAGIHALCAGDVAGATALLTAAAALGVHVADVPDGSPGPRQAPGPRRGRQARPAPPPRPTPPGTGRAS